MELNSDVHEIIRKKVIKILLFLKNLDTLKKVNRPIPYTMCINTICRDTNTQGNE
jgi:hypothetical protein